MKCVCDYFENTIIYDRTLHDVRELIGDVELGQLSLASLLSIHAVISNSEQATDPTILKLLDFLSLHVFERLSFVPEGWPFGEFIYAQEKPCLCLKHVFYVKKLLLNYFEMKLALVGQEKLNAVSQLFYDRIVKRFVSLSACCIEQDDEKTDCFFSVKDIENALVKKDGIEEYSQYFNEIKNKIVEELEEVKFLNKLAEKNVWQGIKLLLTRLKNQKQPFGAVGCS